MRLTNIGLTASISAIALGVAAPALAAAQASQPAEVGAPTLEPSDAPNTSIADATADIVVTAQRRSQRLQDVPVAVSVVSGTQLAQSNLTSLESVSARLPAVKIVAGPLTDYLNIRGVGSGQNAGFEQSVGTFVDGLYRGRSKAMRAVLFDVDQVEVLKGPQATFFGNNAIAGALNIMTRKPGPRFEYNASGSYDIDYGEYIAQAGVTIPLDDTLSIRLAGQAAGKDGYTYNRNTEQHGPRDRDWLGRAALRWEPSDRWRTELRVDIGRQRSRNALAAIVLYCPTTLAGPFDVACPLFQVDNGGAVGAKPYYHSHSPPTFVHYDFVETALTNSVDLGGVTLSTITGYFHHDYQSLIQLIPVSTPGVGGSAQAPSPYSEKVSQFSQEIRLQSAPGGFFEWMVGGYYSHVSTDVTSRFGAYFLPFGAFNPLGNTTAASQIAAENRQRYQDNSYSGFGSATIRPIDNLRINLALRHTSVHKNAHRHERFGTAPNVDFSQFVEFDPLTSSVLAAILGADPGDFPDTTRKDGRFLPSAGLQYDFSRDVMGYFTFSKGFKAGGFSAGNTIDTFGPETVNVYEIGIKSALFDRRLTLNADIFRSNYSDLQETTITFNPLPVNGVANAAASRAQGVELSAAFQLTSNLRLTSDVAYLDSKYQSYPNGVCTMAQAAAVPTGCVQDMSGKRRAYAPKYSGNIGVDLAIPVGSRVIHVSPLMYFSSSFFTTASADPLLKQKGYTKVDARISYGPQNRQWELAIVGKNLTNEATAAYRNPLTSGNGSVYALPDPSRSIAVQFSIKG